MRLVKGLLWAALLVGGASHQSPVRAAQATGSYICPMHPDVHGASGDTCPRCGMALVNIAGARFEANPVDLEITPRHLKAGQQGTLKATVRDPLTREPIRDLEEVHERPLHLFIVSRDLSHFSHVHPVPTKEGSLEAPFSVPEPGAYQLYFDFMPRGGTPQLVQRSFITSGYDGGIKPSRIAPDTSPKVDRNVRVELQLPADGLVAGRTQLFRASLSNANSREPITDLQQYLGASGHLFLVSDDLEYAVHSHPIPDFSDEGGPNVVFEAVFPRPGLYRFWAQFQRAAQVFVTPFTVSVRPE